MIAYFPDPYPDEILYSVLARYQDYTGISSYDMAKDLNDHQRFGWTLWPTRIERILSALPPGHRYSSESIIWTTTLLPYIAPFVDLRTVKSYVDTMAGDGARQTTMTHIGGSGRVWRQTWQYCPDCMQSDTIKFGEPYWHRVHQLPGVFVCPNHAVYLEPGPQRQKGTVRELFSSLRRQLPESRRPVDEQSRQGQLLLGIARNSAWLLQHPETRPQGPELSQTYRALLREGGWANSTFVRQDDSFQAFLQYFDALEDPYRCHIDERHWFKRMVWNGYIYRPPLHHILMAMFLGVTLDRLLSDDTKSSTAQERQAGPWPCRNRICPSFRKLCIPASESTRNGTVFFRYPYCGYAYSVSRAGHVITVEVGDLLSHSLKEILEGPPRSIASISAELGWDRVRLMRQIRNHGLDLPTWWPQRVRRVNPDALCLAREAFLALLASHSEASRSHLKTLEPRLYDWLRDHDRAWLAEQLPPVRNRNWNVIGGSKENVLADARQAWLEFSAANPSAAPTKALHIAHSLYSWLYTHDPEWLRQQIQAARVSQANRQVLDAQMAGMVQDAAIRLLSQAGRPVRVTFTSIARTLPDRNLFAWLRNHRQHYPLVVGTLANVLEDDLAYSRRRMRFFLNQVIHNSGHRIPTVFTMMLRINPPPAVREIIAHEVEAELQQILDGDGALKEV